MDISNFKKKIFEISNKQEFEKLALELFNYQINNNKFYKKYCDLLGFNTNTIKAIEDIPFLPIEFFKTEKILCNNIHHSHIFYSSGTSSEVKSKHYIDDIKFYEKNSAYCFKKFWGNIDDYIFFCLTPNKNEAPNSSLVHMCDFFIKSSNKTASGFYLNNYEKLKVEIQKAQRNKSQFILIGLSFAILDLAEKNKFDLAGGQLIETGGMKNKKKEMVRENLYDILKEKFNLNSIQSEYGMTELLSQSYSYKNGEFESPPWKKILIREITNPLKINNATTGGINIIDLSNIHSCAFIATSDYGKISNNKFKVLGRLQNSSMRGCNTML